MAEADYDYESMIAEAAASLSQLEGRVLRRFIVHVVEPEFNVAYFIFSGWRPRDTSCFTPTHAARLPTARISAMSFSTTIPAMITRI